MRLYLCILLLTMFGWASPGLAKDFAPCAPPSETAREMAQATGWISCQGVPSEETVGVPPYPNAAVARATSGGTYLPSVVLLSTDPDTRVIEFYKKALSSQDGWHWNDLLKIFYKGGSISEAMAMTIPSVQISPVTDGADNFFLVSKDFRSRVKSKIEIHYRQLSATAASPPGQN
jgi:hypothetical protein